MRCATCFHAKSDHEFGGPSYAYCWECLKEPFPKGHIHKFTDNLTYIEQLAKKQGLV